MNFDISLWAALLLPFFFWCAYHYFKDRHRPEPIWLLIAAILMGYLAGYLSLALYQSLEYFNLRMDAYALAKHSQLHLFLFCSLIIGPIEELAKFVPFVLIFIHLKHFDEPIDGVVYASFIALGFALHETKIYLPHLSYETGLARSITSPLLHAIFASIWGYAYGFADIKKKNRFKLCALGLLAAMLIHGVFDFFSLLVSPLANILPPLIIVVLWFWRQKLFIRVKGSKALLKPLRTRSLNPFERDP